MPDLTNDSRREPIILTTSTTIGELERELLRLGGSVERHAAGLPASPRRHRHATT
jgi:hypothetical protein